MDLLKPTLIFNHIKASVPSKDAAREKLTMSSILESFFKTKSKLASPMELQQHRLVYLFVILRCIFRNHGERIKVKKV